MCGFRHFVRNKKQIFAEDEEKKTYKTGTVTTLNWIWMNLINKYKVEIKIKIPITMPIGDRSSDLIRLNSHQIRNSGRIHSHHLNSITRYRLNACLTTTFLLYMFNGHFHLSKSRFFFLWWRLTHHKKSRMLSKHSHSLASCEILYSPATAWVSSH